MHLWPNREGPKRNRYADLSSYFVPDFLNLSAAGPEMVCQRSWEEDIPKHSESQAFD
jgi:hypothetical protein